MLGNLSNSAMRPKTNKGSNYTLPLKATPGNYCTEKTKDEPVLLVLCYRDNFPETPK